MQPPWEGFPCKCQMPIPNAPEFEGRCSDAFEMRSAIARLPFFTTFFSVTQLNHVPCFSSSLIFTSAFRTSRKGSRRRPTKMIKKRCEWWEASWCWFSYTLFSTEHYHSPCRQWCLKDFLLLCSGCYQPFIIPGLYRTSQVHPRKERRQATAAAKTICRAALFSISKAKTAVPCHC